MLQIVSRTMITITIIFISLNQYRFKVHLCEEIYILFYELFFCFVFGNFMFILNILTDSDLNTVKSMIFLLKVNIYLILQIKLMLQRCYK